MNPTPIETRALTPARLGDLLAFFEQRAFTDHPEWRSCYCHFPHADHRVIRWHDRTGAENRAATSALVEAGTMNGVLAYDGDIAVGWCNAGPRRAIEHLFDDPEPLADRIGAIACFVVAPPYRGRGIARALLEAATTGLRARGFAWIEAYPRRDPASAAENHFGPRALFEAAGFSVVRLEGDDGVVMRKALGTADPAADLDAEKCEASR